MKAKEIQASRMKYIDVMDKVKPVKLLPITANFYFTVVSEPSHDIITRSIFILPTSQNRHSSHVQKLSLSPIL